MVKLNNQSKHEHFDILNLFLDSMPFWKSCKPYFSNNNLFGDSKIVLNESGEILTENKKIAKTFNSNLESVTDSLEPLPQTGHFSQMSPVTKCITLLKFFPIILVLLKLSTSSS